MSLVDIASAIGMKEAGPERMGKFKLCAVVFPVPFLGVNVHFPDEVLTILIMLLAPAVSSPDYPNPALSRM